MKIAFAIGSVLACLVISLLGTWVVWELQIDGRAFHCTDDGPFTLSGAFWTSADTHRTAGDQIQAGWTWEKVAMVNGFYKLAFFALWIGGSTMIVRRIYETSEGGLREHSPHPAA